MTNPSDSSDHKATCVARRHLDASPFMTYDAMLAVVKSAAKKLEKEGKWKEGEPLPPFFGSSKELGNLNNRNESIERDNQKKLVQLGWLIRLDPPDKQRRFHGRMDSTRYRVVLHDEFVEAHPKSCPPDKYVTVRGGHKRVSATTHRPPAAIERGKVRERLNKAGLDWQPSPVGDALLDALVDQQWKRIHSTSAETPAQVTAAEISVTVRDRCGNLRDGKPTTVAEISATTAAEPSATDRCGTFRDIAYTNQRASQACTTNPQPVAVDGLFHKYLSTIGIPAKKHKQAFTELAANHDIEILDKALAAIVADGFGDDVQSKWGITIHRLPEKVALFEQKRAEEIERKKQEVRIEESIKRQQAADHERWNHEPEPQNEASIEDLM